MKRTRLAGFIIAILAGIAAGLIYGWVVSPAKVSNTDLESLRADFKADYILMVAEGYAADGNLDDAVEKLEPISTTNVLAAVQDGLVTAQLMGYSNTELLFMAELEKALTGSQTGEESQ